MSFEQIDLENWERKEFYHHFLNQVVCSYSLTVSLDVTPLKGEKLWFICTPSSEGQSNAL